MQDEFRRALEDGDYRLLKKASHQLWPHLPQPETNADAEAAMHHARTQASWMPLGKRAWSHRWLTERTLPSGLPDNLRPGAERMFPQVCRSVGISVNARSEYMREAIPQVRGAVEDAVNEAYADGRQDDIEFIKVRMHEAKERAWARLFGKGSYYG